MLEVDGASACDATMIVDEPTCDATAIVEVRSETKDGSELSSGSSIVRSPMGIRDLGTMLIPKEGMLTDLPIMLSPIKKTVPALRDANGKLMYTNLVWSSPHWSDSTSESQSPASLEPITKRAKRDLKKN